MTSCNDAIVSVTRQRLSWQLESMKYRTRKNDKWKEVQAQIKLINTKYPQDIDVKYEHGWYVQTGGQFIELEGEQHDCSQ